ncbi:NACHT and WD repeat domain-containing protein [Nocardia sp. NPDC051052]|uniref:NACHT and WD repeat domain-containing protein n=1 Tax=Nocardia sp. NPDC051052 TaxID=3364322 RepID=UPI00378CFE3D
MDEGRRNFAARFGELFAAAGTPPAKSVVRAANARVPDGASKVTPQRISDWRRGNRTPATFIAVRPVLEVLIAEARRRAADNPRLDPSLLDLVRWHEDWKAAKVEPPSIDIGREPYRGLWEYRVEDRDLFFGRDDAKRQLLELISNAETSQSPAMAVLLGPAGVGKSSLLAAGLQAAPGARTPIAMTPGDDPMVALEAALDARPSGHCLLLVDRGEELFTRCANEALRQQFLTVLASLAATDAEPPTTVVVAFDTAHLPELLRYPLLTMVLRDHAMLLNPMTPQELREAIVRPAAATGLRIEDSLVDTLLQDLNSMDAHSSVRLPLLSFALAATWANRRGRTLSLEAYRETGGLARACAVGAEAFWSRLTDRQRDAARHVLVALTIIGPTTIVRNRMPIEQLIEESTDPDATRATIARLIRARIVVQRGGDIELVHDLLLAGWPRMAGWLAEEKEFAPARQRIEADAREWARQDRPMSLLYSRTRLEDAAAWMRRADSPNLLTREFVAASLARQRAGTVRRRVLWSVVAVLAALALVLSGVVVVQRVSVAQEHRGVVLGQLVEQSQRVQSVDPALSAQLALAAYRLSPDDPMARARLLATQVLPLDIASAVAHHGLVRDLALSPNRKLLASAGSDGFLRLWDVSDPRAITPAGPELSGHRGNVNAVAFSPDGNVLASAGDDGTVRLWDVRDPHRARELGEFVNGTAATAIAYLPDGRTVVAGGADGTLSFLDIEVPQAIQRRGTPIAAQAGAVEVLTMAPDRPVLASAGGDRSVRLWAVADADHPTALGAPVDSESAVQAVALGPDGRLGAGTADGVVQVWNIDDQGRAQLVGRQQSRPVPITKLQFWLDGKMLSIADAGGTLRALNTARRDRVSPIGREIHGSSGSAQSFVIVSDTQAVTAGSDGRIRTWSHAGVNVPIVFAGSLSSVGFDRAGKLLASGLRDGQVNVWDISNPFYSRSVGGVTAGPPDPHGTQVALRPDGTLLATGGGGEVRLWNLADPTRPVPIGALPGTGLGGPIAFDPSGKRLLTGVDRRSLRLWDVADPAAARPLAELSTGHDRVLERAVFAPDRALIAAADDGSRIHLWDIADPGKPVETALDAGGANVRSLVFAPGGSTLFGADDNGMIRSWDVTDLARVHDLGSVRAHTAAIRTLAIDRSGHRLASGGDDQTARLWNIADPSDIQPLGDPIAAAIGWMWFLQFDPSDESRLFGVGDELSALWYTDPDAVADKLCAAAAAQIDERTWRELLPSVRYIATC